MKCKANLPTGSSETSLVNTRCTLCKHPETRKQCLFHGETLKSRMLWATYCFCMLQNHHIIFAISFLKMIILGILGKTVCQNQQFWNYSCCKNNTFRKSPFDIITHFLYAEFMWTTKNKWPSMLFYLHSISQELLFLFLKQYGFSCFPTTFSTCLLLPSLFTYSSNAILSLAFQCQYSVWETTLKGACPFCICEVLTSPQPCHSTTIPYLALMWLHFVSNVMGRLPILYVTKPSQYFCYFLLRNDHCGKTWEYCGSGPRILKLLMQ